MIMNPPPPIPDENELTTPTHSAVAIAASVAVPLSFRTVPNNNLLLTHRILIKNRTYRTCILIILLIAITYPIIIWFNLTNQLEINIDPHERKPSYLVSGKNGVVSSSEPRCSKIGIEVLKENGTSTDAAIAAAICIGVVNSFASGIGGGGFMIIKPRRGSTTDPITIDYRETASDDPQSGHNHRKGRLVGIPGQIAGFHKAYQISGGGVSWYRIFKPSIDLATNFTVEFYLIDLLDHYFNINQNAGKHPARLGDWIQRSNYAHTLQIIAEQGIKPFYEGEIAQQLVDTINREGGKASMEDFRAYTPIVDRAINTTYHGYNIWTTRPPSSGIILLHMMNILERYSLHDHPRTELSEHRFIEALKYGFSARTELGDPRYMTPAQLSRLDVIKPPNIIAINDSRTYEYSHYEPKFDILDDHGTSSLSVIDRYGSVTSLTTSINIDFGAKIMDPINGIILNNQIDDFSIRGQSNPYHLSSSPLNYQEKGKRPLSSMSPIIVDYIGEDRSRNDNREHEFFAAISASGGSRIFGSVAGTLLKLLWGYDIAHAIEDPRVHHQLLPDRLCIEIGYRPEFMNSLISKGHQTIRMGDIYYDASDVQGIHKRISDPLLFGASDSRKFGGEPTRMDSSKYTPLSAADCFFESLLVTTKPDKHFRVYRNLAAKSETHSQIVFVFHHGAGYSALSAACLARQVREQGHQRYGFLSFDCRSHGGTRVENQDQAVTPDLSLSTLAKDMVEVLQTIYPDKTHAPAFVLVGHSMGGAVVTEACAPIQASVGTVLGLVILDVVEGSALSALISMIPLINSRPSTFNSPTECIKYHLDSHTIRNLDSARISVPSLIRKRSSPSSTNPDSEIQKGSDGACFEWVTDLRSSQPYWEGWYRGLSQKFLCQKTARLLVLAGTDRLDKELMIGQMQGKYQLVVLANVGHCVHEDDPVKLAELLINFADRNDHSSSDQILARLGKKPLQKIFPSPVIGSGSSLHPTT
ncbi:hypothetical protein PSHT_07645, partial [Puccinia striiformis]